MATMLAMLEPDASSPLSDLLLHRPALLVGNGINRHGAAPGTNSWEGLLTALARQHLNPQHEGVPAGVSPTEFFDVLELALHRSPGAPRSTGHKALQAQFCELMGQWQPLPQHGHIMRWAQQSQAPVLTTNFEHSLAQAAGCSLQHCGPSRQAFTAFYPWGRCFAPGPVADPLQAFAIWHVHGMAHYRQSVRLGLSHYMGAVQRVRGWLTQAGNRLYKPQHMASWPGAHTWLQVFFHKPLLCFGLGLGENEVFLRWLFIERARYFQRFPERAQPAWFVHVHGSGDLTPGKALFLQGVGVQPVAVAGHEQVYAAQVWA